MREVIVTSATATAAEECNRNQLDTLFIVTRIMTSSLTCRPILYWDEAGLVLFVIFVTRVAEIVTSWARSKIIRSRASGIRCPRLKRGDVALASHRN